MDRNKGEEQELLVEGAEGGWCSPDRNSKREHEKYLRSVNIVLCRDRRHCGSHAERRVRGAQCEGVFLREGC